MSWSGTVTCSHCYTRGHNKRKCPTLTESILNDYKMWSEGVKRHEDSPTQAQYHRDRAEHFRTQYIKRTKIDPATGEKVKNKVAKAERMKNVTCGYCRDSGHTRRICEVVKRDKLVFIEASRRCRVAAFEDAVNRGMGVGSMVPIRTHGYHGPDNEWGMYTSLRYVKSVDWKSVTSARPSLWVTHIEATKLAAPNQNQWTSRDKVAKMLENFEDARGIAAAEGQKAPPASLIPSLDPPDGWLECEPSTIDVADAFPTKGGKYEKQRQHTYSWPSGLTADVIRDLGLEEHWKGRF